MIPCYLKVCCSADRGGRTKITGLDAAPVTCPPNSQHPRRSISDVRRRRCCHNIHHYNNQCLSLTDIISARISWALLFNSVRLTPTHVRVRRILASTSVVRDALLLDLVCQSRDGCGGSWPPSSYYGFGGKGIMASVTVVVGHVYGGLDPIEPVPVNPGDDGDPKPNPLQPPPPPPPPQKAPIT